MLMRVTDDASPAAGDSGPPCHLIETAMGVLGRAWAGAVLEAMMNGAERFSDIRRAVDGITDAVLTTRLRELCERGLAERTVDPGPPVSVRYTLTPAGRDTQPILDAIAAFGTRYHHLLR